MVRVRQGDMVEVTLHNSAGSRMVHSLDFHAAIGPGGDAILSQVVPGQQKTFTFQATTPGLFVYHCGTPMISDHIANGMYGLILVEPPGGLPRADREYYVMQGEIYTAAPKGKPGLQSFSEGSLMKESPQYFVFNGAVDALSKQHPLEAKTGQTVRLFFGDAGPNATSSFHVVGEIFSRDYQLGSLSSPLEGVQTATVPAGGAAILELKAATAGRFNFMDHAMARMSKGLVGTLDVQGEQVAELMHAGPAASIPGAPQLTASGLAAAEEITDDGRTRLAPVSPKVSPAASEAGQTLTAGHNVHPAANLKPASTPTAGGEHNLKNARINGARATELDGCFVMDGVAKVRLFRSRKVYNLEPRAMLFRDSPLAFAHSVNKLVHITGHFNRDTQLYGGQWFVVETIDALSASCESSQSLAQLLSTRRQKLEAVNTAPLSAVVVGMSDMSFTSAAITIRAGQTVLWKNTSGTVHNVVDDAAQAVNAADVLLPAGVKPFDSGYLQPGQSYQRTFTVPGVYRYVCTLHETGGMKGTIVVKASPATDLASAEAGPGR